jgi:hypothetical protein
MKKIGNLAMLLAGLGFMGGYLWGVDRWAGHWGRAAGELSPVALSGGFVAALIYVGILGAWVVAGPGAVEARSAVGGSRNIVSTLICRGEALFSAAVLGSFCLGAIGIRTALWMVA